MPLLPAAVAVVLSTGAPSDPDAQRLPLVLDAGIAGDLALRDELALRLPERPILGLVSGEAPPREFLFVGVGEASSGALDLQVITSDGRLYRRRVPLPTQGDRARVTAGAVANLVDGIERRTLTPDQTEVEIPLEDPPAEPEVPPDAEPAIETTPQPEPDPRSSEPAPPGPALHLTLGGALALGLGPPEAVAGIVGAGGLLGAAWVRPKGLLLGGRVRALGWGEDDLCVARVQLWAQAGYAWTRGPWSVVAAGGPTVEPLSIRPAVREPSGTRRPSVPLVGLSASAGPRWRAWGRPQGPTLWVAFDLEMSVSAEARRDMGVLLVRDASTETPLLRAGGVELVPTLSLELRTGLRG